MYLLISLEKWKPLYEKYNTLDFNKNLKQFGNST